ncbi:PTS system fructose-specific EIIABC component [bacterium BMS3Bbin04]|nr:PTS system fructose-specific EIIABC component [bacterium BMS3Bbin04]
MRFSDLISHETIDLNLRSKIKETVIKNLVKKASDAHNLQASSIIKAVLDRERALPTGVGQGVAVPHATLESLDKPIIGFGRTKAGINFDSIDGAPVHLIFLLITPGGDVPLHLKVLSRISRLCQQPALRDDLLSATSSQQILDALKAAEHSFRDL